MKTLIFLLTIPLLTHQKNSECSSLYLRGHRIATTSPHKTIPHQSLQACEQNCLQTIGCTSFAYSSKPPFNNTCELAIAGRNSRDADLKNSTDISPPWDLFLIDRENCGVREFLYERESSDCFYRLLSAKRFSKSHSLKSISVGTLAECQAACVREAGFNCRGVSFRYMAGGYSYSVSNCELSPFFISPNQPVNPVDFVDDYDYDYFQREPYCKTTGGGGAGEFGVCAVVVRRGGRLAGSLSKSSHQVTTPSQCEQLCVTSFARCRGFGFRHTSHGSTRSYQTAHSCHLYEVDIQRLPSYNIEQDVDWDIYEMGRLMGGTCRLERNQNYPANNYPANNYQQGSYVDRYRPVTPVYERPIDRPMDREIGRDYYNNRDYYNRDYNRDYNQGQGNLLPGGKGNYYLDEKFPTPGPKEELPKRPEITTDRNYDNRHMITGSSGTTAPHIDGEGCPHPTHPTGSSLSPQITRATFPVKSIEECRLECRRAMEVLRFPCSVVGYRPPTSGSSASCQLSETPINSIRESDFVPMHGGLVFVFDDGGRGCGNGYPGGSYASGSYPSGSYQSGYYNQQRYPNSGSGYYDRYQPERNYDRNYDRYPNYESRDRDRFTDRYDRFGSNYDRNYQDRYQDRNYDRNYDRYNDRHQLSNSGYYDRDRTYQTNSLQNTLTVDGERCLASCVRNRDAGFYYCQIDHEGAWNFCCRPDDQGGQCGYSRGLSFAWCYVGSGSTRDVWRTCKRLPSASFVHEKQPNEVHAINATISNGGLSVGGVVDLLDKDEKVVVDLNEGAKNGTKE